MQWCNDGEVPCASAMGAAADVSCQGRCGGLGWTCHPKRHVCVEEAAGRPRRPLTPEHRMLLYKRPPATA